MPHSALVGRWSMTSDQFSAVRVKRPPGLPNSVAILARRRLSPIPTAHDRWVRVRTASWILAANASASAGPSTVAPTNASSQPMTSTTTPSMLRSTAMTSADAASYAGLSAGRNTASGQRARAVRSGIPDRMPNSRAG